MRALHWAAADHRTKRPWGIKRKSIVQLAFGLPFEGSRHDVGLGTIMTRNKTIDPTAPTPAVQNPEVPEVFSAPCGRTFSAPRLIRKIPYHRYVRLRSALWKALKDGTPRYLCPLCGCGLRLRSSMNKEASFVHGPAEGRACSERTRGLSESEIRRFKYGGRQEGEPHKRAKERIVRSLRADNRFAAVVVEGTWRGDVDRSSRRRPDVRAEIGDLSLAFEAQLSTTFLSVVLERQAFYRENGGLLVWVLPSFDPQNRRQTDDDILFCNNSNVLLVDEESTLESERSGELHFGCWIAHRDIDDEGRSRTRWERRLVGWDGLTIDQDGQRAFAVDVEGAERKARTEARPASLRTRWRRFFEELDGLDSSSASERFFALRSETEAARLPFPSLLYLSSGLRATVRSVLSAEAGRPVGYKFDKLVQIAFLLTDQFPSAVTPFLCALKEHGLSSRLAENKKWPERQVTLRERVRADPAKFLLAEDEHEFVCFLFPDVAGSMNRARAAISRGL